MFLGLDLATTTGWAIGSPGNGPTEWGSILLPTAANKAHGRYLARLRDFLEMTFSSHEIESVIYERPILPTMRGATQFATLRRLYSLCGVAELCCYEHGVPCFEVHIGTWRKSFLGAGNVKNARENLKRATIEECRRRGFDVQDDNAADAIGVLEYLLSSVSRERGLQTTPLFARAN